MSLPIEAREKKTFFATINSFAQVQSPKQDIKFMIRHTVVFKLKFQKNSRQEQDFLDAAKELANIPGVQNFECLRQTSKKNNFDFGLSMEFSSQKLYDEYCSHPDHVQFIEEHWLKYVENFVEIDYEPLK